MTHKHKKLTLIGIFILIILCSLYYVMRTPSSRLFRYLSTGSKWSATNINYDFTFKVEKSHVGYHETSYSNYSNYSEDDVECKLEIAFGFGNALYLPVKFNEKHPITYNDGSYYYENGSIQYSVEECLCEGTAFISKDTIIIILKSNHLFPNNIKYIKFKRIE